MKCTPNVKTASAMWDIADVLQLTRKTPQTIVRIKNASLRGMSEISSRPLTGAVPFLRPNKAHFPALCAGDYLIPYTHRRTQRGGKAASQQAICALFLLR